MGLSLSSSVGVLGHNKVLDVARVQVILRLVYASTGKPYYKGSVDGYVGGRMTGAIKLFFHEHYEDISVAEQKKIKIHMPVFKPGSAMLKELLSYNVQVNWLGKLKNFAGTKAFYIDQPGHIDQNFNEADYFLPSKEYRKFTDALRTFPFVPKIHEVRLESTQKFRIKITFPNASFLDPQTLEMSSTPHAAVVAAFQKILSSTPWKVAGLKNGFVEVFSRGTFKLFNAMVNLDQYNGIGRVLLDVGEAAQGSVQQLPSILIPQKDMMIKAVAQIHVAVCTGDKYLEGIDADVRKFVDDVIKKVPNALDKLIAKKCESCEQIGQQLSELHKLIVEQVNAKGDQFLLFQRFVTDELSLDKYGENIDDALKKSMRALVDFTQLPIDGGDLIAQNSVSLSAGSVVKKSGEGLHKLSDQLEDGNIRKAKLARAGDLVITLSKLMVAKDVMDAFLALGEVLVDTPQYFEDVERLEKRYELLQKNVNELEIVIQSNEMQIGVLTEQFEAQKCGSAHYPV